MECLLLHDNQCYTTIYSILCGVNGIIPIIRLNGDRNGLGNHCITSVLIEFCIGELFIFFLDVPLCSLLCVTIWTGILAALPVLISVVKLISLLGWYYCVWGSLFRWLWKPWLLHMCLYAFRIVLLLWSVINFRGRINLSFYFLYVYIFIYFYSCTFWHAPSCLHDMWLITSECSLVCHSWVCQYPCAWL